MEGESVLTNLAQEQAGEDDGNQEDKEENGEGSEDAGDLFPAFGEGEAKSQRNDNAQNLTTHLPEQEARIGIRFHACQQVDRTTQHNDQEARDEDRPGGVAHEISTPSRQRLWRDEAETPLSLEPGQKRCSHTPANEIAQVVSRYSGAQRNWKQDEDVEITKGSEGSRGEKQQRSRNRDTSGSNENSEPERYIAILMQCFDKERVQYGIPPDDGERDRRSV